MDEPEFLGLLHFDDMMKAEPPDIMIGLVVGPGPEASLIEDHAIAVPLDNPRHELRSIGI